MTENELATLAIGIALKIHRQYGPGLFESVYLEIFCFEWNKTGLNFQRQVAIPLIHENIKMDIAFKADVVLDGKLIVEMKAIEKLTEIHFKQLLTYLKLTNMKLGLLINFNVPLLKNGVHRVVNKL
jgi:GxxExxY protein